MRSSWIRFNSDSYGTGPISLSSVLQQITCKLFFLSLSLNVANIAEVIAIDNYEPNQDLISQSAPCTSWLKLTRLNVKTWSADKACLPAAGWGAGGSDPTFIFPETRWLCYSQVRLGLTGKRQCQLLMGIILKFKEVTERQENAAVTSGDKSVWKMKEPGNLQWKCCQDCGVRDILTQMYEN